MSGRIGDECINHFLVARNEEADERDGESEMERTDYYRRWHAINLTRSPHAVHSMRGSKETLLTHNAKQVAALQRRPTFNLGSRAINSWHIFTFHSILSAVFNSFSSFFLDKNSKIELHYSR